MLAIQNEFLDPHSLNDHRRSIFSDGHARNVWSVPEDVEFVMGGVAQAIAVDAAELATGKPLLWSTIQFNAAARNHQSIDIDVIGQSGGRSLSQVRVDVTANQKPVQSIFAALGGRPR